MKTCCFTGHRNLTDEQRKITTIELVGCIEYLINEGYTHFITGMASGVDLLAAGIILQFKRTNKNIFLEAAVPHQNRLKCNDPNFINILNHRNKVTVIQEKYDISCFMERNKYMVNNSDIVIAIWDGRKSGGTYNTIKYAESQEKKVVTIPY